MVKALNKNPKLQPTLHKNIITKTFLMIYEAKCNRKMGVNHNSRKYCLFD